MKRLAEATLDQVKPGVGVPTYERSATTIGVVHIGPGAFFRAHLASYLDRLLALDPSVAIAAVALNTSAVRDALAPQDGLYTLAEIGTQTRYRVIGAVRALLVAPEEPEAFFALVASPRTRLVTLTVTEKGYHLDASGDLDLTDPAVAADVTGGRRPTTLPGWLAKGLAARRAVGGPPLTVLSCDNLVDNGPKLRRALLRFAEAAGDADLARWIAAEVRFPRTMVDSITPATDDDLRRRVDASLGLHDAWPVQREPFTQWVIEDGMAKGAPDLAAAGAVMAPSVKPFEQAKLRLLNAAHSTLAYVGALTGLETVAQSMAQPHLAAFVERLMRESIAPTVAPDSALNLDAYIADVLERFRNPALHHRLAQIACDGSQKLPVRLFETAGEIVSHGGDLRPIATPIAAWMRFIRLQHERGAALTDPLAGALNACLRDEGAQEVQALLALRAVFPQALAQSPAFEAAVLKQHAALADDPLGALTP